MKKVLIVALVTIALFSCRKGVIEQPKPTGIFYFKAQVVDIDGKTQDSQTRAIQF